MKSISVAALVAGLAASASWAQPTATNLGTLSVGTPVTAMPMVDPAGVAWYTFTLSNAVGGLRYLDIDTEGSALAPSNDTEIGVFDSTGALIASDDDGGSGLMSQLSFGGACVPARPAVGGLAYNGRNGNLAAGTYFISVSGFNSTFAAGWLVTTASANAGPATLTLVLGQGMPPMTVPGVFQEPCETDAGDLPASAARVESQTGALTAITGTIAGADVDMFLIDICNASMFSATTFGGATFDTQLFLFTPAGLGIVVNDDNPVGGGLTSTLTNTFVTANGQYLLAVTGYNRDPQDSGGQLLWINTPFNTERAPDGPGAASPVGGWLNTPAGGTYTIALTGACFIGAGGGGCDDIDFNNDEVFPSTGDLEDFLSVFGGGPCSTDPAPGCNDIDFNNDGVFPSTDDLEAFLRVFGGGAC